jgi:hypothetical protein
MSTETPRERAAQVQARRRAELERIRNDRDLTSEARKRLLSEAHERTKAELRQLQQEQRDADAAARASLVRAAFGAKPGDSSYLSDLDRARGKVTSRDKAHEELELAELAGAGSYARAIALVADQHGWQDVLRKAAEQAGTGQAVAQLTEHLDQTQRERTSDMMTFSAMTPPELTRGYVDRSAQSTVQVDERPGTPMRTF